jgi:hypothetical protein
MTFAYRSARFHVLAGQSLADPAVRTNPEPGSDMFTEPAKPAWLGFYDLAMAAGAFRATERPYASASC